MTTAKRLSASQSSNILSISLEEAGIKPIFLPCQAPHYRTLKDKDKRHREPTMEELFDSSNRVINLDAIPAEHHEAKTYFEKYYSDRSVAISKPGRYVQVKDDGIYSYMYDVSDDVLRVKNDRGEEFLEFFLD